MGENIIVEPDGLEESNDPYLGAVLDGRFRIEKKLGSGGYGQVYVGTQLAVNRKVAIKLLHPDLSRDAEVTARFRREGLVMCNLRSEHTVTTFDVAQTSNGDMFIVMELLEGRNLAEILFHEAPLPWRRVVGLMRQICMALGEAHERGIVHRDLKPANIQIEQRPDIGDFAKVLDFGIAKIVEGEHLGMEQVTQLTAKGETIGTLRYMSPEQLLGKPLDGRSDIYALGVLCYQLLTGRVPFPKAKVPVDLIAAQLQEEPEALSKRMPGAGIPPALDKLVARMLDKDVNRRFADANALRRACKMLLANESDSAAGGSSERASASSLPSISEPVAVSGPDDQTRVVGAAPGKATSSVTMVAIAVAVVIAVILALTLSR